MIPSRQTTDTKTPENALREFFHRVRPAGVASVYLYGSAARGRMHAESDIDVAVLLDRASFPSREQRAEERVRLTAELIHVLGKNERRSRHSQRRTPRPRAPCNNRGDSGVRGGPRGGSRLLPGRPAARRGSRPVPAQNAADKAQGPLLVTWRSRLSTSEVQGDSLGKSMTMPWYFLM